MFGSGLPSAGFRVVTRIASIGINIATDIAGEVARRVLPDEGLPKLGAGSAGTPEPPPTMEHLLRESLRQSPEQGRRELHERLLRDLAPDEARILATLSDQAPRPMLGVPAPGRDGVAAVEFVTDVGREAAVSVNELTPAYVRRLIALGLVTEGPVDHALLERYEILLAEPEVREALKASGRLPGRGPKAERQTLQISKLGLELWRSATGEGSEGGES